MLRFFAFYFSLVSAKVVKIRFTLLMGLLTSHYLAYESTCNRTNLIHSKSHHSCLDLFRFFPGTLGNYCMVLNLRTSTSYLAMHYIMRQAVTMTLYIFFCTTGTNQKTGPVNEHAEQERTQFFLASLFVFCVPHMHISVPYN
jgi:hypothetical protein